VRATLELGGVVWRLAEGARPADVAPLLERALAALESGRATNLKSGRRKQLYRLALRGGPEPDHLLKCNHYHGARRWLGRLRGSKARRELGRAEAVATRGIPTVRPLAAGERRRGGGLDACYLLVPVLPGAVDLRRFWFETKSAPGERRAVARALGALVREMHAAGLHQDDLAPNNFLVQPGERPALFVIDFERAPLRRRVGARRRRRALAKLDRHMARASTSARLRFLLTYTDGDREVAWRWWRRVEAFAPRLARHDHARMRRNAVRDGRRYARVAAGAWQGWRRREVGEEALLAATRQARFEDSARALAGEATWHVTHPDLDARHARELWARANSLWLRGGLVPRPHGLLRQGPRTLLVLERAPGSRLAAEQAGDAALEPALCGLLGRLLAIGELAPEIAASDLACDPAEGSLRGVLLRPERFRFRGGGRPGRRARARLLARALLGARS
jgi:hypothetical protein